MSPAKAAPKPKETKSAGSAQQTRVLKLVNKERVLRMDLITGRLSIDLFNIHTGVKDNLSESFFI